MKVSPFIAICYIIIASVHLVTFIVSMEVPSANDIDDIDSTLKSTINGETDDDGKVDVRTPEEKIAELESKLKEVESLLLSGTFIESSTPEEESENDDVYRGKGFRSASHYKAPQRRIRRNTELPSYYGSNDPSVCVPYSHNCMYPCGQPSPPLGCQCGTESTAESEAPMGKAGTTYVRWGRSDCPDTAHKVYGGIMGGAWSGTNPGSGSNYICLPTNPIYGTAVSGVQSGRSAIHSVELSNPADFPPYAHIQNHEMTCAVCRVENRSTSLMIPARNICPSDEWTLEYSGYLTADQIANYRSEYICLDEVPEGVPGTAGSVFGANLYITEGICVGGGLPCGPYINGHELSCAVCSL